MIESRHLRHALALADHRNFVRAARSVGISQPALSRSIAALEVTLGVTLFERGRRSIEPTEAGRIFLLRARDILKRGDDLQKELGCLASGETIELAVGAGPYPAELLLVDAAAEMLRALPRVRLRVVVGAWHEMVRELRNQHIDLCIVEATPYLDDSDLSVTPLTECAGVIAVRSGHPLAGRKRVALEEILEFPMVAPTRLPPRLLSMFLKARPSNGDADAFPSVVCEHLGVVRSLIAATNAFGLMVRSQIAGDRRFVALACDLPWLKSAYGIIQRRHFRPTPVMSQFVDFVKQSDDCLARRERSLQPKPKGRDALARIA